MQWQPIETAPKDGTEVILCRATDADGRPIVGEDFGVFVQVAGWWTDRWVVYCSTVLDPDLHFEPTHWMPLPAPPDTQRTDPPKNVDERFESLAAEYASLYHESQTRTLCEPHHFEDVQQKNERWYRDCVGQGFDPNKVARHGIELYKRPPQVHDKP